MDAVNMQSSHWPGHATFILQISIASFGLLRIDRDQDSMFPLGFITDLLGMNLDGIPGSKELPWDFEAVIWILVVLVIVQMAVMRRLKWF